MRLQLDDNQNSGTIQRVVLLALIIVIAVAITLLLLADRSHPTVNKSVARTGCVTQQFTIGDSGSCVGTIQTLVNFMETDGLTECPFPGGSRLTATNSYDAATQKQVQIVQGWENCYNKQEGSSLRIDANGIVATSTWSELCTYAYHYPMQAGARVSPYRQAAMTAGKNAGCGELF